LCYYSSTFNANLHVHEFSCFVIVIDISNIYGLTKYHLEGQALCHEAVIDENSITSNFYLIVSEADVNYVISRFLFIQTQLTNNISATLQ